MGANFPPMRPRNGPITAARESVSDVGPILFFGNVRFDSAWQRAQQLALCLSEGTDVVYVDPNRSFLQVFRHRDSQAHSAFEPQPSRLFHQRPCAGLPFARSFGCVNRVNYAQTIHGLRSFMARRGLWPPRAVIMTFPDQVECANAIGDVPLVYDLMDEPTLFLRRWQIRRFQRMHDELLERAQVVVTSARVLLERYGARARRAVYISNGVRHQLLRELLAPLPTPQQANLPRPRLGYVGTMSHWFDFETVQALARTFSHGSVILVGPVDRGAPRLPSNVVFTGPVPHLQLAPWLRAFDIGLIPFRRCPAIDAVNPVKLYEYLAAGLPVLASNFAELAEFGPLVTTYRNQVSCIAAARTILNQPSTPAQIQARRSFAERHCWSVKAAQLLDAVRHAQSDWAASATCEPACNSAMLEVKGTTPCASSS